MLIVHNCKFYHDFIVTLLWGGGMVGRGGKKPRRDTRTDKQTDGHA